MDPTLLVSLTGAACLGLAVLLAGAVLVFWRLAGRRAKAKENREVAAAISKAALDRGMGEHGPGVWEGLLAGRRLRWNLRDVEYDTGSRSQLALGTPVPTGALGVTYRTLIYGAAPPQSDLPQVRIGDAAFDMRFHINADLEHLSLLQPEVRAALGNAADDAQLRIRNGWLWLDHPATPELPFELDRRVDALFAAARAIEGVGREVEARVRKMSNDPVARVRSVVLDLLIARGASDFTTWIAKPLVSDLDAQVSARAAEIVSDLPRLSAIVKDKTAPMDARLRAAKVLSVSGTPEQRLAAADALSKEEGPAAQAALELCTGLADDSENVLIELLHRRAGSVARGAVALLGIVGSARSLVVLQSLCDAEDTSAVLRTEAKAVLDTIRSKSNRRRSTSSVPPAPPSNPPQAPRNPRSAPPSAPRSRQKSDGR